MKHQPKYNIGENVIVLDVSGDFKEAEIKGHMLIQRGENLNYKGELAYIITEVSANTDEMHTDARVKLYHEDCIYRNQNDLTEKKMKVSDKTYRELQALILSSEGKTLEEELGFGCRVKFKDGDDQDYMNDYPELLVTGGGFPAINEVYISYIHDIEKTQSQCSFSKNRIEILGLPIDLARILKALSLIEVVWRLKPSSKDTVNIIFDTEEAPERIVWNLDLPAHLQEEETITKLTELLK